MRPFRFGLARSRAGTADEILATARRAETVGYDVYLIADHLGLLSVFPTLTAVAAVTERLRIGTYVVANDYRPLAILAEDAATVDFFSEGRLELGIGAGWMKGEYDAAGWTFDRAPVRIARLEESATLLRRLFAGEKVTHEGEHYRLDGFELAHLPPQGARLPLLIGGNGDKLLSVAGRHADIVSFTGFSSRQGGQEVDITHWTDEGLADRIDVVRRAAGDRFAELELNMLIQRAAVTDDPEATAARFVDEGRLARSSPITAEELLASPFVLLGTVEEIADRLRSFRTRFGVSYVTVSDERSEGFDAVVELLAGT